LKATTTLVWSPQLVISREPSRMRIHRAFGARWWLDLGGMISTVHTPFRIRADTAPKICPHFCAPSPASETISSVCSPSVVSRRATLGGAPTTEGSNDVATSAPVSRVRRWVRASSSGCGLPPADSGIRRRRLK
jgi:hypothetical protein